MSILYLWSFVRCRSTSRDRALSGNQVNVMPYRLHIYNENSLRTRLTMTRRAVSSQSRVILKPISFLRIPVFLFYIDKMGEILHFLYLTASGKWKQDGYFGGFYLITLWEKYFWRMKIDIEECGNRYIVRSLSIFRCVLFFTSRFISFIYIDTQLLRRYFFIIIYYYLRYAKIR